MNSWDLGSLELDARLPEILSSTDEGRAVALDLAAGERLGEHEVHERAWVVVIAGELEATSTAGGNVVGGPGLVLEFSPRERHELVARSATRLLMLLTPWPGIEHPGTMTVREKLYVRRHAAKRKQEAPGPGA